MYILSYCLKYDNLFVKNLVIKQVIIAEKTLKLLSFQQNNLCCATLKDLTMKRFSIKSIQQYNNTHTVNKTNHDLMRNSNIIIQKMRKMIK